jgi:uncharacterized protein YcfJ
VQEVGVGTGVGYLLGIALGKSVGMGVGDALGTPVGVAEGTWVGNPVGVEVMHTPPLPQTPTSQSASERHSMPGSKQSQPLIPQKIPWQVSGQQSPPSKLHGAELYMVPPPSPFPSHHPSPRDAGLSTVHTSPVGEGVGETVGDKLGTPVGVAEGALVGNPVGVEFMHTPSLPQTPAPQSASERHAAIGERVGETVGSRVQPHVLRHCWALGVSQKMGFTRSSSEHVAELMRSTHGVEKGGS